MLDEAHTASQNLRMLERKKRNSESADASRCHWCKQAAGPVPAQLRNSVLAGSLTLSRVQLLGLPWWCSG